MRYSCHGHAIHRLCVSEKYNKNNAQWYILSVSLRLTQKQIKVVKLCSTSTILSDKGRRHIFLAVSEALYFCAAATDTNISKCPPQVISILWLIEYRKLLSVGSDMLYISTMRIYFIQRVIHIFE